jgi:hypothetical protein
MSKDVEEESQDEEIEDAKKVSLEKSEGDLGVVEVDDLYQFVAGLVRRLGDEPEFQSTRGRTIDQPFAVREDTIEELDDYVRSQLTGLDIPGNEVIDFKSEVGYENLSEASYTDLNELFMKAGDEPQAPSRLLLVWEVLLPNLSAARIVILFDTKKSEGGLKRSELLMDPGPNSDLRYKVAGEDENRDWVEQTAKYLDSKLEGLGLNHYHYKPLKIFRSNAFVNSISWAIGWIGFIISIGFLDRLYEQSNNISENTVRTRILETGGIENKFDIFARYTFREDNLIVEPLFTLGGGIILAITLIAAGRLLLPKLAPRSGMLIGSQQSIWKKYDNLVKFAVSTVIFGSLISWIIFKFLNILFL